MLITWTELHQNLNENSKIEHDLNSKNFGNLI
jgi:hypothetical protein